MHGGAVVVYWSMKKRAMGASRLHTRHFQRGLFRLTSLPVELSKHWRCLHENERTGSVILAMEYYVIEESIKTAAYRITKG